MSNRVPTGNKHVSKRALRGAALFLPVALAGVLLAAFTARPQAQSPKPGLPLTMLSSDPFTNPSSQHATQVEPDTFSFGSTIVAAFQSGRFSDGGSSDIGWATSTNGGTTWTKGFLPGITVNEGSGPYQRDTDPSVAFDAKHNVWMINSLPLNQPETGIAVVNSRSTDGGLTWQNPVTVARATGSTSFDKNWIVCDNTSSSPFFGNCYVEYDEPSGGNTLQMSTSTDGGLTWTPAKAPNAGVIGGQPLVQPSGNVIVPMDDSFEGDIISVMSTDGGKTYTGPVTVSAISDHGVAGNLRTSPLPSAEIDGAGTVYVAWQDCRFRAGCKSNDIVYSTSTDGTHWTAVRRVPIDPVTGTMDHFIPGIAVDPATSGATAHIGVTFYFYQKANCMPATCRMSVGFISSRNGGLTWGRAAILNPTPMQTSWLPSTILGNMVGDYISTSFSNGLAHAAFAVASAPVGGVFNEAMFTNTSGLPVVAKGDVYSSAGDVADPNAKSDHPPHHEPNTEPPNVRLRMK